MWEEQLAASWVPPTGDPACNPGMCPDQELNQQPFGSQVNTQSTEPHQPEHTLYIIWRFKGYLAEILGNNLKDTYFVFIILDTVV